MTHDEFIKWRSKATVAMGFATSGEAKFLEAWEAPLKPVEFADACVALETVIADSRWTETRIRADRLPLVLDHASEARANRRRAPAPSQCEVITSDPTNNERWDLRLLALKIIDQNEFNRRQGKEGK